MIYFSDEFIDKIIKEDVPYLDLTTTLLQIGEKTGTLSFQVREEGVVACTEEAARVFHKLGIELVSLLPSGTLVEKGTTILQGRGRADKLHMAWKICVNILEYCCGIASNARNLLNKAQAINSQLAIVATRKCMPGTKELVIKAAWAGGIFPHRLGLSETILIFEQHLNFLGGIKALKAILPELKIKSPEKKIIVEVDNLNDALALAISEVDGIQFDKVAPQDLKGYVKQVRSINSKITIIAAGGINQSNVEEYAVTGVNAIATSCVFHGKPLDIGAKMLSSEKE